MKHTLLALFTLVLLCSCQKPSGQITQNKNQPTKNVSEADRVKITLVIPALDALSYQLEKVGYDTQALNQINKYLKENSISEFFENNSIAKEIEKVIKNTDKKSVNKKGNEKQASFSQQQVFETF